MADKMEKVGQGDIEILADWLEEECPNALASFQRISLTVDFTPAGGRVSSAIAESSSAGPIASDDLSQQLNAEMRKCAAKQMLPDGSACAALSFALYAGRLPSAVDGNGMNFGSEVRLSNEYKTLCKVKIDNLEKAFDMGTNLALDAYFDGLIDATVGGQRPTVNAVKDCNLVSECAHDLPRRR